MRKKSSLLGTCLVFIFLLGTTLPCLADNFTGDWYECIDPFGGISKPTNTRIQLTITQGKDAYRVDVNVRPFDPISVDYFNQRLETVQKDYPGDYQPGRDGKSLANGSKTIKFISKGETFQVSNSGGYLLTEDLKEEQRQAGIKTVMLTAKEDMLDVTDLGFFKRGKMIFQTIGPEQIEETRENLTSINSALAIWHMDKGTWPVSLDALVPHYVDKIPAEEITGSSKVIKKLDGKGGWVYNPQTGEVLLNLKGKDPNGKAYASYGPN